MKWIRHKNRQVCNSSTRHPGMGSNPRGPPAAGPRLPPEEKNDGECRPRHISSRQIMDSCVCL